MNTRPLLLAALLAGFLAPALAEEEADAPLRVVQHEDMRADDMPADAMRFHAPRIHGRAVKNAPYSAQAVSERIQQLADGNQIERRTRSASYRDSAGRTRLEVLDDKGELRTVTINDPVANATWILNPRTRTATRLPRPDLARAQAVAAREAAQAARAAADASRASADASRAAAETSRAAAEAARARVEQLRREGRLPQVEQRDGPNGREIVVRRVERDAGGTRETVRVIEAPKLAGAGPDAHAFAARIGPLVAGAAGDGKWSSKAVSRALGTREFDGVKAEGRLRSYEIPAGEIGNRAPIVVADESWYAPELQMTVYAKHSDPRSGEFVYRLENVKRGEPEAGLFAVPGDYTVRDVQAVVERRAGRKDDAAKQEGK
ncbi:MAG: hypothetical protein AB1584_16275 [Pseudomonadota bacterium]